MLYLPTLFRSKKPEQVGSLSLLSFFSELFRFLGLAVYFWPSVDSSLQLYDVSAKTEFYATLSLDVFSTTGRTRRRVM